MAPEGRLDGEFRDVAHDGFDGLTEGAALRVEVHEDEVVRGDECREGVAVFEADWLLECGPASRIGELGIGGRFSWHERR